MNSSENIPEEIKHYFIHKNIKYKVSRMEQYMLDDLLMNDENSKIKLSRDVTKDINAEIQMYLEEKRNIRYMGKGQTRCLPRNTRILTSKFIEKPIQNIEVGDKVFSFNPDTNLIEESKVEQIFDNGTQHCYEIELEGGRKIKASQHHKFYSLKKIREAYQTHIIGKGVRAGWKNHKPQFTQPKWVEVKDLKIKEYIAIPDEIPYYKKTKYDLNEIILLGFWISDGYCKLEFKKKYEFDKKRKDYFTQMIYDLGLAGKLCGDKFVPNVIKQSTKEEIYAFLGGLFSGDGTIDLTKGLHYVTKSRILFEDVKILLTKLGITYREYEKWSNLNGKRYLHYHIFVTKLSSCINLYSNIDFRDEMRIKLKKYIDSRNVNVPKNRDVCKDGNVIYKKIKSIKYIGEKEVYDFQVEKNHNYIANLMFSHNSGKSLFFMIFVDKIFDFNGIDFNENLVKAICGNQVEYRQKLKDAQFGDVYLVDENFFTNAGIGSSIEISQLKDFNSIIAKQNISVFYITPERFLPVGATIGFDSWGRDSNNWLSRFLVYMMKNNFPHLIGYVVADVGKLFRKHGCYVYKFTGGCVNNKRIKDFSEIPKDVIKHSTCIPEEYRQNPESAFSLVTRDKKGIPKDCPFYEVCTHGLCKYEHKKDTWITKEMEGGMDDRTNERFKLSIQLLFTLSPSFNPERDGIMLKAKNGKDLKNRLRLRLHNFTNTKLGIAEFEELCEMVKTNTDVNMLMETLYTIKDEELLNKFFNMEIHEKFRNDVPSDYLNQRYQEFISDKEKLQKIENEQEKEEEVEEDTQEESQL